MKRAPCASLAELRSAFVDGAVTGKDRDRVLNHLASCDPCRAEVDDLQRVRHLVSGVSSAGRCTPSLSARLSAIAEDTSLRRRLDRWWHGRRARQTRTGLVAVGVSLVAVTLPGYVAAPAEPAALSDPAGEARAEFGSSSGQALLSRNAMNAVFTANPSRLRVADVVPAAATGASAAVPPSSREDISPAEALQRLRRAQLASHTVSYSGLQSLAVAVAGRTVQARVQVEAEPGQGNQSSVLGSDGAVIQTRFVPSEGLAVGDAELWTLLQQNFVLHGSGGARMAGRPATLVEASRQGAMVSRWWLDDASGLVLWQESFDDTGQPLTSAGFTSITVRSQRGLIDHLPARLPVSTTRSRTLSSSEQLSAGGWFADPTLAGLALVRVRTDTADDPQAVSLVYSDGLHTVAVVQRRGRLVGAPPQTRWDAALEAYVGLGAATSATWPTGRSVSTVVTDGSPRLLAEAVAALPHEAVENPTRMGRIQAGWAEILADFRG